VTAVDQSMPLYRHLRVRDMLAAARYLAWGSYVTRPWFEGSHGQRLSTDSVYAEMNWIHPDAWMARHHLTYWVAYQPQRRLVWFELARNGIPIAIAVLAVLAAVWWLRRHPAERVSSLSISIYAR
jgi:hypothetical protein